jgi:hypothetical protein
MFSKKTLGSWNFSACAFFQRILQLITKINLKNECSCQSRTPTLMGKFEPTLGCHLAARLWYSSKQLSPNPNRWNLLGSFAQHFPAMIILTTHTNI